MRATRLAPWRTSFGLGISQNSPVLVRVQCSTSRHLTISFQNDRFPGYVYKLGWATL